MSNFPSLGLSPAILTALENANFTQPTPIQQKAIPLALDGHDILGLAQTGTGKTLAFGLPIVDQLLAEQGRPAPKTAKALVLAPTRELVNQIADNLRPLVKGTKTKVTTIVGGQSINRQINALERGTDIVVATPGRLIDLMDRGAVKLSTVRYLVLDEADQMLDMGFIHALRKIAPQLGTPRQTMLFSATMPKQLEQLSQQYLTNPQKVQVSPPGKTADKIEQAVEFLEQGQKPHRLREILSEDLDALTLVFARTKHGAERLMKKLVADGYNAASIHGNKSQGQRDRAIKAFREGEITILVATDVAARGIDIPGVAYVINYDLPNVPESYVHRIGRTARAGREGKAIAFCSNEERLLLRDIEKLVGKNFGAMDGEGAALAKSKKPAKKQGNRNKSRRNPAPKSEARREGAPAKRNRNRRRRGKGGNSGGGDAPRAGLTRMLGADGS
ncbi:DEAD/DEAH box helicase [Actibacterium atlanticum]|uniref:DEAD/DEAH box helicase n=1 Tax=Actibacterium atlanticum TaxID=1461693 RepID=UPI0006895AA2|nr:DEAD/DEAH box helicase [Actibacterium atlanticum]